MELDTGLVMQNSKQVEYMGSFTMVWKFWVVRSWEIGRAVGPVGCDGASHGAGRAGAEADILYG